MRKKPMTNEQEINLLLLEIKKNNQEISQSTYKAVKSCILNSKPITHIKITETERKYLEVFTMPQNAEFITECFRIQDNIHKELEKIKNQK